MSLGEKCRRFGSRRSWAVAHLGVDAAAAAEVARGGDEVPPELGGEEAAHLLQLGQVPAPGRRVDQARRRLAQLLGAVAVRVHERGALHDEVAVALEHEQRVERVLLAHDLLGAEQRAVGGAQAEQLLRVAARLRAPHLPVAAQHAQARDRQAQQRLEPRRLLRRPAQQHVQPPPHSAQIKLPSYNRRRADGESGVARVRN